MAENDPGWIVKVAAPPPTLNDNRADADRLLDALKPLLQTDHMDMDLSLLKNISKNLREWSYQTRCVCLKHHGRWKLIHLKDVRDPRPFLGIAVDIGTTRVAATLINLDTGRRISETVFDNPQISVRADILTRVHFAGCDDGLKKLNQLIIEGLNDAITAVCGQSGHGEEDVTLISVAGNTTMTHLFLNLSPQWIIREPYIPVVNSPGILRPVDLGLKANEAAAVVVFPNVGSYFGGDLISGILYSGLYEKEAVSMMVDVGTNAEVVLGNKDWLVACAGAAGPALEGGMSKIGMTARPGVIDEVAIDPATGEFHLHTIDEIPAIGICGSGMIDLAAHLFLSGMIDFRGKFVKARCGARLREEDGMRRVIVVPKEESGAGEELSISQADLDSLIRSKAAMYTILDTITRYVGVGFSDLSTFYVSGAFGSLIKPKSAIAIGMIPDLPDETFRSLGNSSLEGAILALTSRDAFDKIETIRSRVTYLELNVNQEFMNRFSAAKFLPHTDPGLFPSVKWMNQPSKDE